MLLSCLFFNANSVFIVFFQLGVVGSAMGDIQNRCNPRWRRLKLASSHGRIEASPRSDETGLPIPSFKKMISLLCMPTKTLWQYNLFFSLPLMAFPTMSSERTETVSRCGSINLRLDRLDAFIAWIGLFFTVPRPTSSHPIRPCSSQWPMPFNSTSA